MPHWPPQQPARRHWPTCGGIEGLVKCGETGRDCVFDSRDEHDGRLAAVIVGVPREIKRDEYRVAILPVGVEEFTRRGHRVVMEPGAGLGSGISDHEYLRAGTRWCRMPRPSSSKPI